MKDEGRIKKGWMDGKKNKKLKDYESKG